MTADKTDTYIPMVNTLLGLFERTGTPVSEELREAAEYLIRKLSVMESKGGLCVELDDTADHQRRIKLLEEAGILGKGSNQLADDPLSDRETPLSPFVLDDAKPGKSRIYSRRNFSSESRLAGLLHALYKAKSSNADALSKQFSTLENEIIKERAEQEKNQGNGPVPRLLNELQKNAANLALTHRFSVICGGPGTGKTTAVVQFLEAFLRENKNARVVLCAPTGKAQSRLLSSVVSQAAEGRDGVSFFPAVQLAIKDNRIDSMTIHKLLVTELPNNKRPSPQNPLDTQLIIVDECSMIDSSLALKLLSVIDPTRTQAVFLGDKRQLAAVGPGSVFADMSDSRGELSKNVVELQESIRFNKNSSIGRLAQGILAFEKEPAPAQEEFIQCFETNDLSGRPKDFGSTGLFLKGRGDDLSAAAKQWLNKYLDKTYIPAVEKLKLTLKNYIAPNSSAFEKLSPEIQEALQETWSALSSFRPLCAQRKGPCGVEAVNNYCETRMKDALSVRTPDEMYTGKVIIVRKNDPGLGVSNGDVAVIFGVKKPESNAWVWYAYIGDLNRVVPAQLLPRYDCAFAMTIHQSQGSDFENVAIFLPSLGKDSGDPGDAENLCTRELLYTGITRAKKTCQVFGSKKALSLSLQRVTQRAGGLPERLKERMTS